MLSIRFPIRAKELPAKIRNDRQIANMIAVFMFLFLCDFRFFIKICFNFLSFGLKNMKMEHHALIIFGRRSIEIKVSPSIIIKSSEFMIPKNTS